MNRSLLLFIFLTQSILAQNTFNGIVLDAQQKPLSGVNVYLLKSYNGTTTNKD
jgi:hypothetical protein